MSKVLNPTKAQLVEKVDQVVSANEALIEDHVEYAGWVESNAGDVSQAVMHALALAKGLGDGSEACSHCLASDLKSIVYALEAADRSIDLIGEQSRDIIDDFDPCIDDYEDDEPESLQEILAEINGQAELERRAGLRN